jgi:hypothetical protein
MNSFEDYPFSDLSMLVLIKWRPTGLRYGAGAGLDSA